MLRLIKCSPRNAAMNMALDEVLFLGYGENKGESRFPVLRFYSWDGEYTTVGYFQKNAGGAVRRMTGGLTVNHKDDLSYGFIAGAEFWDCVYSESDTYRNLHDSIRKALLQAGFECSFLPAKHGNASNICVQTLYENDLIYKGEKVAGSCSRRRGTKILVQGSVHIKLNDAQKETVQTAFSVELAALIASFNPPQGQGALYEQDFTQEEIKQAEILAAEKYSNKTWNDKF